MFNVIFTWGFLCILQRKDTQGFMAWIGMVKSCILSNIIDHFIEKNYLNLILQIDGNRP